jgi:hypothetical protein
MGLILDSRILVAGDGAERRSSRFQRVQAVLGEAAAALSSVSIIELTHGVFGPKRTRTVSGARPSATSYVGT